MHVYVIPGNGELERLVYFRPEPLSETAVAALRRGTPLADVLLQESTDGVGTLKPSPNVLRTGVEHARQWGSVMNGRLRSIAAGWFDLPEAEVTMHDLCVAA